MPRIPRGPRFFARLLLSTAAYHYHALAHEALGAENYPGALIFVFAAAVLDSVLTKIHGE